jgi:hypothetical protein
MHDGDSIIQSLPIHNPATHTSISPSTPTIMTQQGSDTTSGSHYWLGRLRDAEENPSGWTAANPQQGGGGGPRVAVSSAIPPANTDHSYWLQRLNQAEANARNVASKN